MVIGKTYTWNRFWAPRTGQLNLGDGGFLWDPEAEYGSIYNPDVKCFSAIDHFPVLGLLGEPGIGKSFAMGKLVDDSKTRIASMGGQVLYVDLRSIGSESRLEKKVFESPEFQAWSAQKTPLHIFLDSLDECILSVQTASRLLSEELLRYPHQNLFIRIACRTWDWPISLENALKMHWGEEHVGIFELAPLRRKDVVEAVIANELNPEQFIQEVFSREVVPFANTPLTLKMLMNIFRHGGGLPTSKVEIYRRGCLLLLDEPNQDRRDDQRFGALSQQQRMIIASRIAALTILAGKNAIWTGLDDGVDSQENLTLLELAGGSEEIEGNQLEITENVLRETLSTGLFSSRGTHRMGWAQQPYAEFLAAYYLTHHRVSQSQITSLVCHPEASGSKLIPQLSETVAWLLSMNSEVFLHLMGIDPEVFLRGDLSFVGEEEKKLLVQKLLRLYDEGGAADSKWNLRKHYEKLAHAELSDQLKPIITDQTKGVIVRRVAIDIAEACKLNSLQLDLVEIALNTNETLHIRVQAACAIRRIGDSETKKALKPLAEAPVDNDPDDELKGYALKSLWPNHISAKDLFECITPPQNDNFIGSYHFFLTETLAPSLTAKNITIAFTWIETAFSGWRRKYVGKKLIYKIFEQAFEFLEEPDVANACARVILKFITHHEYEKLESLHKLKAIGEVSAKQCITNAVLALVENAVAKHDGAFYPQTGIVNTSDVPWLIERCKGEQSEKIRQYLAEMVKYLFLYEQSALILNMCETDPVFAEKFNDIRKPVLLDSPEARRMRKIARSGQNARKKITPHPMVRITTSLEKIESGFPNHWADLLMNMSMDEYGHKPWPDSDVKTLSGWQTADQQTRERIVSAAKMYLLDGVPKIDSLFESSTFLGAIVSDHALRLLLAEDPSFIESLNPNIWSKWAKVVLCYSAVHGDRDQGQKLLIHAYHHASDQIIEGIAQLIAKGASGHHISLQQVTHIWDEQIAQTLLVKVVTPGLPLYMQGSLLELLLENNVVEGLHFAKTQIPCPVPTTDDGLQRAVLAAQKLMMHAPDAGWSHVWPAFQSNTTFGHSLMAQLSESAISNLSENQAADLYIWLKQNDPHTEEMADDGPSRLTDFKDALLRHLRVRGTLGACLGIEKIIAAFPNVLWLKWSLHECQELYRRNTWQPPTPKEILLLSENRSSVLVRSGEELLDVIIASLRRLEQNLHGVTPMARFLWDGDRPKNENDFSDYVEDHFKKDLKARGIVANREVEFRRLSQSGVGEKTDIVVDAVCKDNRGFGTVTVVIESKGCWNKELETAMESQLLKKYLIDDQHRHGLYLVGWFCCCNWNDGDYRKKHSKKLTIEEAQAHFDKQATELSQGQFNIQAVVLNTALPESPS